jgi:hypothetical protein
VGLQDAVIQDSGRRSRNFLNQRSTSPNSGAPEYVPESKCHKGAKAQSCTKSSYHKATANLDSVPSQEIWLCSMRG